MINPSPAYRPPAVAVPSASANKGRPPAADERPPPPPQTPPPGEETEVVTVQTRLSPPTPTPTVPQQAPVPPPPPATAPLEDAFPAVVQPTRRLQPPGGLDRYRHRTQSAAAQPVNPRPTASPPAAAVPAAVPVQRQPPPSKPNSTRPKMAPRGGRGSIKPPSVCTVCGVKCLMNAVDSTKAVKRLVEKHWTGATVTLRPGSKPGSGKSAPASATLRGHGRPDTPVKQQPALMP